MKKVMSLFLITVLIMSSLSVSWARAQDCLTPADGWDDEGGVLKGASHYPISIEGGIRFDLSSYSSGNSFSKTFYIRNNNEVKVKVYLYFDGNKISNIDKKNILVNRKETDTITISPYSRKKVTVSGIIPSGKKNWEATLRVVNMTYYNSYHELYFFGSQPNNDAPTNLRTTYNEYMDTLNILWDPMHAGITHYKVYVERSKKGQWEYLGQAKQFTMVNGQKSDYVSFRVSNAYKEGILYKRYMVIGCNHGQSAPAFVQYRFGDVWLP
ncbi:hypothetical protein [Marinisporobacter balticus]|uniref:Uncharacterized protein n=1 Tax=Marinisporobacter balticus TaxID=2018667 RepID=A0A4R2L008_9FIRM|nr:hypothetical protein [Marinisporobacter balticus]TCO79543.1 hypothetical protein EV214_102268 [Marinisporobacter balticus]